MSSIEVLECGGSFAFFWGGNFGGILFLLVWVCFVLCFSYLPFWQAIGFYCLKIIPAELREEKCEFSMNFSKNLVLANQKIFQNNLRS